MVWKFDKQTILHDGIALDLIKFLMKIEMMIVEVSMVCVCVARHEVLMYSAVIKMDVLLVLSMLSSSSISLMLSEMNTRK